MALQQGHAKRDASVILGFFPECFGTFAGAVALFFGSRQRVPQSQGKSLIELTCSSQQSCVTTRKISQRLSEDLWEALSRGTAALAWPQSDSVDHPNCALCGHAGVLEAGRTPGEGAGLPNMPKSAFRCKGRGPLCSRSALLGLLG